MTPLVSFILHTKNSIVLHIKAEKSQIWPVQLVKDLEIDAPVVNQVQNLDVW